MASVIVYGLSFDPDHSSGSRTSPTLAQKPPADQDRDLPALRAAEARVLSGRLQAG